MNSMHNHLIFGIVVIVAGIMMIIGPLISKSQPTKWAAVAFTTAGIAGIVLGILIICLFFGAAYFSSITLTLLEHYKTLLSGFEVGVIVTLAIAGQLKLSKNKKKLEVNSSDKNSNN